jgi:DHA1 family bicyclomycin/chloramphenicol resistance-like MFS transporter
MAADFAGLVGARVLQGAGSAAGMVVGRAMVQDLFEGPERTRVMAYVGMAMGLSPPLAMLVGGQLHVLLGWQANFILVGLLSLALGLACWRWLPGDGEQTRTQAHWLGEMARAYARLAREPVFLLYVAMVAMTTATFYTFLAGAPIVLGRYGVGPDRVGWYVMFVSIAYVAGNFMTSRLIHRYGERRMMVLGHLSSVLGLVLMLSLGWAGLATPLAFAGPLILLGLGHGFSMPAALAGSVGVVPALAGAAAAVAGLAQQLLGAFGGYAVGLFRHDGAISLGLLMLGFTLLASGALGLLHASAAWRSR